jgi:dihydrofolate reductase
MRKIVYSVAMSLDGYVAGPNGEADWITTDPEIDFVALFARFDSVLMGRKTYEQVKVMGGGAGWSAPRFLVHLIRETALRN